MVQRLQVCLTVTKIPHTEIMNIDVCSLNYEADIGYIFEVGPDELHDDHNDYAVAPEVLEITPQMLSAYNQNILNRLSMKMSPVKNFITNNTIN